jgi:hypothetical protein
MAPKSSMLSEHYATSSSLHRGILKHARSAKPYTYLALGLRVTEFPFFVAGDPAQRKRRGGLIGPWPIVVVMQKERYGRTLRPRAKVLSGRAPHKLERKDHVALRFPAKRARLMFQPRMAANAASRSRGTTVHEPPSRIVGEIKERHKGYFIASPASFADPGEWNITAHHTPSRRSSTPTVD